MADTTVTVRARTPLQRPTLRLERVVQETHDTVSLVFAPTDVPLQYRAGQFCTVDVHQFPALREQVASLEAGKGRKEPARSYSVASAPHEPNLVLTVKEEPVIPGAAWPPLLSPHLVRGLRPGDPVEVTGFQGPYTWPDDVEAQAEHAVHLVAGSGCVPNFSLVKDALHRGLALRHTFICTNRTWEDACFRDALATLAARHPGKLRVVHALTREQDGARFHGDVRQGRVGERLLSELVPDAVAARFYVCGPAIRAWERRAALEAGTQATPRFLESMLGLLHELGVPDRHIKREAFG